MQAMSAVEMTLVTSVKGRVGVGHGGSVAISPWVAPPVPPLFAVPSLPPTVSVAVLPAPTS